MRRTYVLVGVLAAVAGFLAASAFLPGALGSRDLTAPTAAPKAETTPAAPPRTAVPRPARARATAPPSDRPDPTDAAASRANGAPTAENARSDAPAPPAADPRPEADTATRGGVDPDLTLSPEGIATVADRMTPSIQACVREWTAVSPELGGEVLLAFQLGPDGVQNAWVAEHASVPAGVLGCFGTAVWEQDWPAAPGGVEVTIPFVVEAGAGLAEPEPGSLPVDRR